MLLLMLCMLLYMMLVFRKQKQLCEKMQVSAQADMKTITVYNKGKAIELPFARIKGVHYYTTELFKANIGGGSKQIPMEHMTIVMQDGQVVYLCFFYELFKYLQDNKDSLPFSLEVHTFRFAHLPSKYNLMSDLYE